MSVDLTDIRIREDAIMPFDFGGPLPSALGGAIDRLERLGDRYAAQVQTPPMYVEPDARRLSARLFKARKEGGIFKIYQPGFNVGAPGTPTVAEDTASGRSIPLVGLTPGYAIRAGQWINYFDSDGQFYLEQVAEQVIANSDGEATVTIQGLLRVPLSEDDPIEIAEPRIEGWLDWDGSYSRPVDGITSFSFAVTEKA